ncbi:UNVERIFIED_CONTAM: Sec1 family domain-containing protein 2 [Trichonephila clavipes]
MHFILIFCLLSTSVKRTPGLNFRGLHKISSILVLIDIKRFLLSNFTQILHCQEALTEVNRSLVECASKEGVKLDLSSRLTPETMKQRTLQFKSKHSLLLKCNGLLQQVLAIVEALNYSNSNSIDNLSAVEKALLEYLALSPEDVLNNIMQMISEKDEISLFASTNPAFPASYNPLLKQLLQDIFDSSITDIPDLEFHSAGLRDYIKTGFSLFMNVTKPQPRDNPVIFIIVLGGVTPSEIKLVQEISAQKKETQVCAQCSYLQIFINFLFSPNIW